MLLFRAFLLLLAVALAVVFAWRLRVPRGPFFGPLLLLLLIALAVESVGAVTSQLGIPNVVMYNVYAMGEFVMLLFLVSRLRPSWRYALIIALIVGMAGMAYSIARQGIASQMALEGLLVIGVVLGTIFLALLIDMALTSTTPLARAPAFWLFTGMLVYFGGTIPLLGTWRIMGELDWQLSQVMYWIVVVLAIVRYLLAAFACNLERQRRTRAT